MKRGMNTSFGIHAVTRAFATTQVVKFWAPWCRACKGLEPKYKRIADQYPSLSFKQLNWEEHRAFCKEIGVTALPLVKFFTSDGEVESFPCGPKKVELLRGKLDEWSVKLGGAEAAPVTVSTAAAVAEAVASSTPEERAAPAPDEVSPSTPEEHDPLAPMVNPKTGLVDLRRLNGRFLKAAAPALFERLDLTVRRLRRRTGLCRGLHTKAAATLLTFPGFKW